MTECEHTESRRYMLVMWLEHIKNKHCTECAQLLADYIQGLIQFVNDELFKIDVQRSELEVEHKKHIAREATTWTEGTHGTPLKKNPQDPGGI